jgi:ATP-dependent Clp protease, protease subunit
MSDRSFEIFFMSPAPRVVNEYVPNIQTENGRIIDLYSALTQKGNLDISTPIDSMTSKAITAAFLHLTKGDYCQDFSLWLNSPGGSVRAGLAIINTMETLGRPVKTICNGTAASMAAVILACGTKGQRYIHEDSEVMIHQPSLTMSGTYSFSELEIIMERLTKTHERLSQIIADRTGQSYAYIREFLRRDRYFDADEAIAFGLADKKILKRAIPPDLLRDRDDEE